MPLTVVQGSADDPCYACGTPAGGCCQAAWCLYGYDIQAARCPVRTGKAALTPDSAARVTAAVATGKPGTPLRPGDPPLWATHVQPPG